MSRHTQPDLDAEIHRALTRVHTTREQLAFRHGDAEARLQLLEQQIVGRDVSWQASGGGPRHRVGDAPA